MTHPFNSKHQWVGSPKDYRTGEAAEKALSEINDNNYWNDDTGIIKVDQQRWEQAQAYEKDTWMKHGLKFNQDRDQTHVRGFGDYKILPANLGHSVEIGSGPFTQTYNIVQGRQVDAITLIDPLANEYKNHPNCRYTRLPVWPTVKPIPAEDFSETGFDIAICINVLEHVRDAELVMNNLVNGIKPGGWLVFHDRVYDGLDITKIYDVGHPIRVTQKFLNPFIRQFTPKHVSYDYFIGVKD